MSWTSCHGRIVPPPHPLPKSPTLISRKWVLHREGKVWRDGRGGVYCCAHWSVHLSMTLTTHLEFGDVSPLCSTVITTTLPQASLHQQPLFPVGKGKPGHWLGLHSSYPGPLWGTRSLTCPSEIKVPIVWSSPERDLSNSKEPTRETRMIRLAPTREDGQTIYLFSFQWSLL